MSEEKPVVNPAPPPTAAKPQPAEIANIEHISLADLLVKVREMATKGERFVTLTCIDAGVEGFEVIYHFDRDLTMSHLSVNVPKSEKLPSITSVYLCAFLVENEIGDHFGLEVDGMPLDFQRHLMLASNAEPTPMLKQQGQQ